MKEEVEEFKAKLHKLLLEEAAECKKSAKMNGDPYGHIFHTLGIVLQDIAKRLYNRPKPPSE